MLTLIDIRTAVRNILNEPTASKWLDDELNGMINDTQRDIAIKTGCYEKIVSLTTTPNTRLVAFDGHKVNYLEYVPDCGDNIGMQRVSMTVLGHIDLNGVTPQYWFTWGSYIVIEPMPLAEYSLNAYVSMWPETELISDINTPLIPVEFHPLLIDGTLAQALLKIKKWGLAAYYYQQYMSRAQTLTSIYQKIRKDVPMDMRLPDIVEKKELKNA